MNKCEHGEKITHFCLTDNCQYKDCGGCEQCLRKHHNHLLHTLHLSEEEVGALLKKYALDNAIKPKCRILQEAVYNYFNEIKNQLVAALETSCKNIINQIGYPYLFAANLLTIYKRLKNKEYRKVNQKELRGFYDAASKMQEKDLAREEARIYTTEIKTIGQILAQLDTQFRAIQTTLKNYSGGFSHDGTYFSKITQVVKSIGAESPVRGKQASKDCKEMKETEKAKDVRQADSKYNKEMSKLNIINSPNGLPQNPKLDYKGLEVKASELKQKMEKVEAELEPVLPPNSHQLNKNQRDISLDKKIIKDHTLKPESAQQRHREAQSSESRIPNQKIENLKLELNHKQLEINQKKKILMDIMRTSQRHDRHERLYDKLDSAEFSPTRPKPVEFPLPRREPCSTQTKSANQSKSSKSSQDLSGMEESAKLADTKNYAFAKLPIEECPKKEEKTVNRKLMIIPTDLKGLTSNKVGELESPLYKKRKVQNFFQQSKFKDENQQKNDLSAKREQSKGKEVIQFKQNEEKSLALLLKSLSLPAEEAIVYLQTALKYADNNLSASEYLSYLYLELNRPKDCLTLCNKVLDKLESTADPDILSINIQNNKAAALNVLGRYSEAILILENCVTFAEKDTFFKNLGDSYFSIGIYEKAIFNYQKSLKLNFHNDESHYNLAVSLYLQQNYENAKLSIKKALELTPKNEAYLQLQSHIEAKIKGI